MAHQFNPFDRGEAYKAHSARWRLEMDIAEMTLDVLEAGTYLAPFSSEEHTNDYAYRKSMSVPLDMCRDGVRIRIDNLWRARPKREVQAGKYAEIIQRLIDNADNDGTNLDQFMRRALWNYYVTGADIVTQVTSVPDGQEVKTLADEQRLGIRPYFLQFTPLDRYDWAVNGSRNFIWARYCLGAVPRADEMGGGEPAGQIVTEFLTLTATQWRRHRATQREGSGQAQVETTEGEHAFGRPPIIKLYFEESQKAGGGAVPLSLLTRPAVVAKVAMNLKSQADADLLAAVTRWYLTGVGEDAVPQSFAPNVLMKLTNPEATIGVVQGDVGHITEKREWLLLYLGEILRLLKFRGGMAEIAAHSGSGLKLAIERTDLDNELRATASTLEATEMEMMRQAVCLAKGVEIPPEQAGKELGYAVAYNRDFVLEPLAEMLANVQRYATGCGFVADVVPGILKEMLRQVRNVLVRDESPVATVIDDEIDAAEFAPTVEAEAEGGE